jgi:hypothetical protein
VFFADANTSSWAVTRIEASAPRRSWTQGGKGTLLPRRAAARGQPPSCSCRLPCWGPSFPRPRTTGVTIGLSVWPSPSSARTHGSRSRCPHCRSYPNCKIYL